MKCNRCGREVDNEEEYCLFCGNNLRNNYKAIAREKDNMKNANNNNKKDDDIEVDNTIINAGKVFLCLTPILIIALLSAVKNFKAAKNPSAEFFGPLPELIAAGTCLLVVIAIIFVPIIMIIIGSFSGMGKNNNDNKKDIDANTNKDNKK